MILVVLWQGEMKNLGNRMNLNQVSIRVKKILKVSLFY